MAVDRATRWFFDRERPIVENPIEPSTAPQVQLVGGLETGRLLRVDKCSSVASLQNRDKELLHHHGRMGWLDPPLAPGGAGDVVTVHERLVQQVASQCGKRHRGAL